MATPFIRILYNVSVSNVRLLSTTLRSPSKSAPGMSQLIKCCGLAKKSRFMISSQGLAMHPIPPSLDFVEGQCTTKNTCCRANMEGDSASSRYLLTVRLLHLYQLT